MKKRVKKIRKDNGGAILSKAQRNKLHREWKHITERIESKTGKRFQRKAGI